MATRRRALLGALLTTSILGAAVAAPAAVLAAGPTVNTLADSNTAGDGSCSLREAITAANLNLDNLNPDCTSGTAGGTDTITWTVSGRITLTSHLPDITDALEIDGNNAIVIDGANSFRVFRVLFESLTLREITLQNGFSNGGFGGALYSEVVTDLDGVTVRSSRAALGGGIHNSGTMTIENSTIEGNSATTSGGGIYNGNSLTARNVTITGNSAPLGGGLLTASSASLVHATIVRNTANSDGGGGFNRSGGTLDVWNSVVVGNTGVQAVGSYGTGGSFVQASATGVVDTALGANGGHTRTIRLPAGSPALSIGMHTYCGEVSYLDQRGFARPSGATDTCDAGAVQRDRVAPVMTANPQVRLRDFQALSGTALRASLVGWVADEGVGIGVERFSLQRQVNGGDWTSLSTTVAAYPDVMAVPWSGSYNTNLSKDKRYRFRVRAVDEDGNLSGWAYSPSVTARLYQQTNSRFTFSSGWTNASSDKYSGGSVKYTKTDGKSMRVTFTGRAFALVTTLRAGQGIVAATYVDGVATGTQDASSSTTKLRLQIWPQVFPTSARHTVRFVVDGTTRFDVDAIAVLE